MTSIAIITARGGSKRIPKKNIRPFCGKPIIAYSIKAALDSKLFDEVMVSTDSEEIATVAKQYGASVPFMRSEKNSNDYAVTADVLEEVITEYQKRSQHFNNYCCLYPTAPFITSVRLEHAFSRFLFQPNTQALVAVVKYSFPPQRSFIIRNNLLQYQYPEHEKTRSQDLEEIYHDCGQFYFGKVNDFMKFHTLIMPQTMPYILSEEEVQDIDTETDWEIAELKYKVFNLK